MSVFRKPFEVYTSPPTNPGSLTRPVYTLVNRHGERSLKQVDTIDIPSMIQSYFAESDVKLMLKRYSLTGDASILRSKGGAYVYEDVSNFETNYAKLLEINRNAALLQLQIIADRQKMSETGKTTEELTSDPVAADAANVLNMNESEVPANE